ncbi:MAG: peptidoglycan recognition protein family protein [Oscillospiraceae bacterium]|nr:peptidoglycan recognition protein family protein [Oscillospiraceae bacterium]
MYLKPDRIRDIGAGGVTLRINEKIIPDGLRAAKDEAAHIPAGGLKKPNKPLNNGKGALGITIHNTPDIQVNPATTPAEQYVRATYNGNMKGTVVTFYVWRDVIWQTLREDEQGWHATDGTGRRPSNRQGVQIGGNLDTISIEAIGSDPITEKTTALLTAYLLRAHSLDPKTDVYPHRFFFPVKECPAFILPHWHAFLARVEDYYSGDVPQQTPACGKAQVITEFTAHDASKILRHAAGKETLGPDEIKRYDFKGDGKLTTAHALRVLRIVAGLDPDGTSAMPGFRDGEHTPTIQRAHKFDEPVIWEGEIIHGDNKDVMWLSDRDVEYTSLADLKKSYNDWVQHTDLVYST